MTSYLAIADAPSAKTNIWQTSVPDQALVEKLLQIGPGPLHIDYLCREIPRMKGETTERYYLRVHAEGRKILRGRLELPAATAIRYEILQSDRTFYFFYLSDKPETDTGIYRAILSAEIPSHRLVQALIGLRVKMDLLDQVKDQYEIDIAHYNAAIYLGTDVYPRKKDERVLIDTFEARFYYSANSELVTTLHNQTFLATSASALQVALDETIMTFRTHQASYLATEKVDSRQYGRKKFMRFQAGYRGCQNHAHTLVARCVTRLFDRLNVTAVQVTFQATAVWDEFLTAAIQVPIGKTVIVDNYGPYPTDALREKVYGQLRQAFGASDVIPSAMIAGYGDLSEETNYVFINKSSGRNGSSIVDSVSKEIFNSFWQAYRLTMSGKECSFDLYTRIKMAHFAEKRKVVMQGIDLPEQLVGGQEKEPISSHVLLKVLKELWLKESVLQRQAISGLSALAEGSYLVVYVRQPENLFFASTLSCRFADGTLCLDEQRTFDNEDELRFAFPMLGHLEKLYDGSFYLYDSASAVLLTAYTNARVPQIMGNVGFDNVQRFDEGGDNLRKLTAPGENPLPYYVTSIARGQYHHIFLQESGQDLRYFVSPKGNPQSTFATQCRTYNILTWDRDGQPVRQIEQSVTNMFLRSFTDDIVLNGQVSKSSLLLKAARLFLEN
jgi:hypothetical protein